MNVLKFLSVTNENPNPEDDVVWFDKLIEINSTIFEGLEIDCIGGGGVAEYGEELETTWLPTDVGLESCDTEIEERGTIGT